MGGTLLSHLASGLDRALQSTIESDCFLRKQAFWGPGRLRPGAQAISDRWLLVSKRATSNLKGVAVAPHGVPECQAPSRSGS